MGRVIGAGRSWANYSAIVAGGACLVSVAAETGRRLAAGNLTDQMDLNKE